MRLRHFLIFVIVAAVLGVATVWHQVRFISLGYELGTASGKIEKLKKSIDNEKVTLLQLTRRENLEKLNREQNLKLEPPG